jgi:hypothetical protein
LNQIWVLAVVVPLLCGGAVTLGAGGAALPKRIIGGAICGGVVGALYPGLSALFGHAGSIALGELAMRCAWGGLVLTIFSTIGVILTELKLPEPK